MLFKGLNVSMIYLEKKGNLFENIQTQVVEVSRRFLTIDRI